MALFKFGNHVDLALYEIRNAKAEIVGSLPSPTAGQGGRLVYLSTTKRLYVCEGSAWSLKATDSDLLNGQNAAYYLARSNHTGSQPASSISDLASVVKAYRLDEFAAPTSAISANSQKITNLANGTASGDAVNRGQLDAVSAVANAAALGVSIKPSVRVVASTNITLSGTQTVDGVALAVGNRVLAAGQTTAANNGIYVVASGAWTRATDADQDGEINPGTLIAVTEGTANADSIWALTSDSTITVGTTAQTWSKFMSGGTYTQGNGISITSGSISVQPKSGGNIVVDGTGVDVDTTKVVRKYTLDPVPTTSASITVTHNLGNQYPVWQVYEKSGGAPVLVPFTPTSANAGTLDFGATPTSNQYVAVFQG